MDSPSMSYTGYWQELSDYDKMNQMFKTGYLSDCTFIVGPDNETSETILGHKLMFIMASPVLEKMLNGQFVEAKGKSEIRIKDTYPHDFKNFCLMVYNNNISNLSKLSLGDIIEVHRLSDKYMVTSISNHIIQHIENMLNTASMNALMTIFEFACGLEDKRLLIAVKKIITPKQEKFDDKLNELSQQVFYEYMQFLCQLSVCSAKTLFSTINAYFLYNNLFEIEDDPKEIQKPSKECEKNDNGSKKDEKDIDKTSKKMDKPKMTEKNGKGKIDTIKESEVFKHNAFQSKLLRLIDFNQISVLDFINGPGKSRLLTLEQKYDMLTKLSQNIPIQNNYL